MKKYFLCMLIIISKIQKNTWLFCKTLLRVWGKMSARLEYSQPNQKLAMVISGKASNKMDILKFLNFVKNRLLRKHVSIFLLVNMFGIRGCIFLVSRLFYVK